MLDCKHCRDLRARLKPLMAGSGDPRYATVDGEAVRTWPSSLRPPDAEVRKCPCGCHSLWKQAMRGT